MVNKREVKRELKSQHRPYMEGEAIYHMYIHTEVKARSVTLCYLVISPQFLYSMS